MNALSAAKQMVRALTGWEIKRMEPGAVALVPRTWRHKAWFSQDLQLQWLLEKNAVDLVIDVGANEGQFGKRLRHTYSGELVSFEPVSAAFEKLSTLADQDPRWIVHHLALGSTQTTATMHVASDTAFSSLLRTNQFSHQRFGRSVQDAEEHVQMRRLDDVLSPLLDQRRRIFLKLDTQGYDLEVFGGLGRLVDSVCLVQSEVSLVPIYDGMPHWTESIATYERAGFHVAGMFPVTTDPSGRVIEYDCLMVRSVA